MVALTVALIVVALIALSTFGLVLVLARRLRAVTERVNMFLPVSEIGLPTPGTPMPDLSLTTVTGERISTSSLPGERFFALLTTDCTSCHDQIPALRNLGQTQDVPPIVTIIGPRADRAKMIAEFGGAAAVVEESGDGAIANALEIHEFPAVLFLRDGIVQASSHGVASVIGAIDAHA